MRNMTMLSLDSLMRIKCECGNIGHISVHKLIITKDNQETGLRYEYRCGKCGLLLALDETTMFSK